jgi:ABC-type transporter Mla MlaB component
VLSEFPFIYLLNYQMINSPNLLFNHFNYVIMNLKITHYSNFFKLKGILDRKNLSIFYKEFNDIFDRENSLTINIEEVEWMDRYGVKAMTELHNEAISKNKKLSIIGMGCRDLYDHFKYQTTA